MLAVGPYVPARAGYAGLVPDKYGVVRVGDQAVAVAADVRGRGHDVLAWCRWQAHQQRAWRRIPRLCGKGMSLVWRHRSCMPL